MGEVNQFIEKADNLAGITTITLVILGLIQVILGETISNSIALTANGIDCIGDGFVSAVVWVGLLFFKKPANEKFHYGYYKMENLASALAAIVMIGLAIYIVFRSYNQLINPEPINTPILGAAIAFIAAVIAISLGVYKYIKCKKSRMSSVKLEAFNTIKDGTASGLAVIALILASMGFLIADAIVGFIIAGIIVTIGFSAIKESSYMLVDACDKECIDRTYSIKKIAEEIENVESANLIKLRKSGPIYQGELEIKVSYDMTIRDFNKTKNKILKKVQSVFPEVKRLTISLAEEKNQKKY
jgi:cation diffusion facilitator family transporter